MVTSAEEAPGQPFPMVLTGFPIIHSAWAITGAFINSGVTGFRAASSQHQPRHAPWTQAHKHSLAWGKYFFLGSVLIPAMSYFQPSLMLGQRDRI